MKKYLVYTTIALAIMAATAGQSYANSFPIDQSHVSANAPVKSIFCVKVLIWEYCPF
jgi:hypothetical protein